MRSSRDLLSWLRDTALRMLPHATRPGLHAVGRPGPDAPVVCTGNFSLTVRRMKEALAGHDVWLLVANSHGINVWCAAGGGHLTHHSIISALRAFAPDRKVAHRTIVLPQLAATGVERRRIADATGWKGVWGPARLEDLPAFLDRGLATRAGERRMRFPLWERLELALTWLLPMALVAAVALTAAIDVVVGIVGGGVVAAGVLGMFAALPLLRVTGPARWLTHGAFAAGGLALGAGLLRLTGHAQAGAVVGVGLASAASMALLALDLAGTTPWYPSSINTIGNHFDLELVDARCTGAAECVLVCPRAVLEMDGPRRKAAIVAPGRCLRCGACIVQCPQGALRFRFADGRVVEAETVRRTRLNLLGRRAIELPDDGAAAATRRRAPGREGGDGPG